jgi:hypothetical protein
MDVSLAAAYQRLLGELSPRLGAAYAELLPKGEERREGGLIACCGFHMCGWFPAFSGGKRPTNEEKNRYSMISAPPRGRGLPTKKASPNATTIRLAISSSASR